MKSILSLEGGYTEVSIPQGRSLKKAEVAKGLLDCDVLINIPIAKDHTGVRFTGTSMTWLRSRATSREQRNLLGRSAINFVLDAEAALLSSRSQLRQAQRSIAIASLLLDLSLGRIRPAAVSPP